MDDDDNSDDGGDENEMDMYLSDGHSSIPLTRHRPAPTMSKNTRDIESDADSESDRKSSEDEDELDNKDPDDSDLLHLDKVSLKEKMSSEVCSLFY
jgi:hypothetical protein